MAKERAQPDLDKLPVCVTEFINLIAKKMRYRKKVRSEVMTELADHFQEALKDCRTDGEKEEKARRLIEEFGDPKLLGILLRRAKKGCRPLWRKALERVAQTIVVLFVCFVIYVAWFLTGKPNISVDYVEVVNQMSRPEILDVDNAWPHYEKAVGLLIEPNEQIMQLPHWRPSRAAYPEFDDLTGSQQEAIRRWVSQNKAAWQEFALAGSKPYCFRKYEVGEGNEDKWTWGILLPHLSELKVLARVGVWRSQIAATEGRTDQAIEDALSVIRTARHWQTKITIIEQLVGLSISRMGHERMLSIAASHKLSAETVENLRQELSQVYSQGFPLMNIEGEKLFFLDAVQQTFTDGGPGGGHMIPQRFAFLSDTWSGGDGYERFDAAIIALSLIHARRDKTLAQANLLYDHMLETARMTPYERHLNNRPDAEDLLLELPKYRYALPRCLMPALERASELAYRGKTVHEAALTVMALQRWQLEKGAYPHNLTELVDVGFLEELPIDPFSDGPLVYKRTDDSFALYSRGCDFDDDGGKLGRDHTGEFERWPDDGDAVLWPLTKPEELRGKEDTTEPGALLSR